MITNLEHDLKKNRSYFIKLDLNKYSVDKNKMKEYPKPLWFKGSRYR